MTPSITRAPYIYRFTITHVRDGDSVKGVLDKGFNEFEGRTDGIDHSDLVECRLYGIDTQEITKSRSKGRGDAEVEKGYDHRDVLLKALGAEPRDIERKSKFHPIPHREVLIETIKDSSGKYGRLLAIIHDNGININEFMRDVVGGVNFYDGKRYPENFPICPPDHPIYDNYLTIDDEVVEAPELAYGIV